MAFQRQVTKIISFEKSWCSLLEIQRLIQAFLVGTFILVKQPTSVLTFFSLFFEEVFIVYRLLVFFSFISARRFWKSFYFEA